MKETSSTVFWLRHLGLALTLVIIAIVVLTIRHNFTSTPRPEGADAPKSLAKGMSDFYESYKLSSSRPFEDDIGDFVNDSMISAFTNIGDAFYELFLDHKGFK